MANLFRTTGFYSRIVTAAVLCAHFNDLKEVLEKRFLKAHYIHNWLDQPICCSNLKSLFFFILLICNHYYIATYARNKMIMANYFVFSTIYIERHLTSNFAPASDSFPNRADCKTAPTIGGKVLEVCGNRQFVGGRRKNSPV